MPQAGTASRRPSNGETPFSPAMREASSLFRAGRYRESLRKYQAIRQRAERERNLDYVARATANMGGCQFALRQYEPALRAFQDARRMALEAGDSGVAAAFEANIASLYMELGDLVAAQQWMRDSLARISGRERADHLPKLQIQMGILLTRQHKEEAAWQYFQQGIDGADRAGDLETYARGWSAMGEEYLKLADPDPGEIGADPSLRPELLARAETALLEAYRVRKLNRLPLDSSYRTLGRLRLAQNDLETAAALLDRAVESSRSAQGIPPTWDIYYRRGVVRMRQGRLAEALADLRVAVKLGRAWRWSAPPDPVARQGTEYALERIHSALVNAGNRLYLKTGDEALARETFEAAEENRASSLRAAAGQPDLRAVPPEFWEALSGLQSAEVQALRAPADKSGQAADALEAAHARLMALESSLGPAYQPLPGGLLDGVRRALDGDSAWLGFHLGEADSWLWAVDREGMAVYRLPARARLEAEIQVTTEAIRRDSPDVAARAAKLYSVLFGPLAPRFRNKTRWLLALDRELFEVPVAALREPVGHATRYVVEGHITQVIPGAGYWLDSMARRPKPAGRSLFVGIGDPIYNTADPRLEPPSARLAGFLTIGMFTAAPAAERPALMLPRLVASAAELDACARAWPGERVLLEGSAASRRELAGRLVREPAVVHFATHFLEVPGTQTDSAIALGLTPGREIDLLMPEEIAHRPLRAGLVVLSGCHSAAGAVVPGGGLLGLTRAFLAAGARSVISSRWATPDDDGALFAGLYANLGTAAPSDAGRALRAAQLAMIRTGGLRARPNYWSAYFLVGSYEF